MRWEVVIPVKASVHAKSRLAATAPDPRLHARLVQAIQQDTIAAVLSTRGLANNCVHRVWVVGEVPGAESEVLVLPDPGGGLNRAVAHAADLIAARPDVDTDTGIAVLVADLPCLVADELVAALAAAADHRRAFVRDWHGSGTTMLATRLGTPLAPAFGPDSARRHAESGAIDLPVGASLRADVDTQTDLVRGGALGLGARTAAVVGAQSAHCA